MEDKAVAILNEHRVMSIATVRPDGWPQATMVGYANDGILIYFIVSRSSQKLANIARDNRVAFTIGREFDDPSSIRALSIAAHASEVRDESQRKHAIAMLLERHPGLRTLKPPTPDHSAVMRAKPELITILDYTKGFGHADLLTVSPGGVEMTPARDDDWGFGTTLRGAS